MTKAILKNRFITRAELWAFQDEQKASNRELKRALPSMSLRLVRTLVDRDADPNEIIKHIDINRLIMVKRNLAMMRALKSKS